jgi:hydroxymethylglutaryl-CoA synthase
MDYSPLHMVGITRLAAYFPRRRLDRALIAQAWGSRAVAGTRTVAAVDEDALTMGVDAALACLGDADPAGFDGLSFASTSAPYLEKQVASVVATAIDLPRHAAVADFGGSARAGLAALRAACDAVRARSLSRVLVVAADVRLAEPGSELEAQLGDGAACAAVGRDEVIAELVSAAAVSEEFTYAWRTDAQRYVQVADARFGNQYGVACDVPEAVGAALRKAELPPARVAKLCLATPDARAAADAAKRIGCDPKTQLEAALETGVLGTPDPLVLLARALETAAPGDFVVVAGYGEGADALVFRATAALAARRPVALAERLAGGLAVPSYERWLRARGVLPSDVGGEAVPTYIEWKERKQDVRLYGSRCEACGLVQYPQALVCIGCQARGRMTDAKLGKTGTVFTFTIDNLAQVAEHPLPMVVADLDGGGRVYLQGTDCAEGDIAIGTRVRLTFRRLHEAGGNRNYFWKVRPE